MRATPTPALVMGLHPANRGFGWVVFNGPAAPLDWGVTYASGERRTAFRGQLKILLERHRPEVLVLEAHTGAVRPPTVTAKAMLEAVTALAGSHGVQMARYPRADVRAALGLGPKATRHAVAEAIAAHVKAFRHRLPPERKPWESAKRQIALFSAAALALTHYVSDNEATDFVFEPCA